MPEKRKILIVDDETDVVDFLKKRLQARDYDVVSATDGIEGLKKAIDEKPDLILLDIVMPNKDGFTMLEELKAKEITKEIPVIIISVKSESSAIFEGQALGATDYLIKPYDFQELLKYIKKYSL